MQAVEAGLEGGDFRRRIEPGHHRAGQQLRRAIVLQQFGHRHLAQQDIGQPDPGLQGLPLHQLPAEGVHAVADHHRPLVQRCLQGGGAAGDEGDVAGGQHLVRAPGHHLDRVPEACAGHRVADGVHLRRDCRHHDAQAGALDPHPVGRLEDGAGQVLHLGGAAARKHGQHLAPLGQPQRAAGRGLVRFLGNDIGQGVADVGGGNAVLREQFGLEGEQAQHVVGGAADLVDPAGPPGPDRGADEVHGAQARAAQAGFEVEVEVGRVDADEQVGPVGQQALLERLADADDAAVVAQHLDVAAHRQAIEGPVGAEAVALHDRPTDAPGLHVRPAPAHAFEQEAGQQVTGDLSRDHADLERHRPAHPALSARSRAGGIRPAGRPTSCRRRAGPRGSRPPGRRCGPGPAPG